MTVASESPSALDELFQELQQATIQPLAMRRENSTIRLLYADSRVDEKRLDPLFGKYLPKVSVSYAFPQRSRIDTYGFTPEQRGKKGNGSGNDDGARVDERVDVITIQLRGYE